MDQWVLGVKVLSGFKGRKFKPWPSRDFLYFFKNLRNFYKNHISRGKKSRGTRIRR